MPAIDTACVGNHKPRSRAGVGADQQPAARAPSLPVASQSPLSAPAFPQRVHTAVRIGCSVVVAGSLARRGDSSPPTQAVNRSAATAAAAASEFWQYLVVHGSCWVRERVCAAALRTSGACMMTSLHVHCTIPILTNSRRHGFPRATSVPLKLEPETHPLTDATDIPATVAQSKPRSLRRPFVVQARPTIPMVQNEIVQASQRGHRFKAQQRRDRVVPSKRCSSPYTARVLVSAVRG